MMLINRKRFVVTIGFFLLLTTLISINYEVLLIGWQKISVIIRTRSWSRYEDINNYKNKKKILFWNTMFGDEWFYMGDKRHFDNCPKYNNCFATNWRWMINVTDYEAILFHANELTYYDLPEKRNPEQIYVFADLESPVNKPIDDPIFENYFNATMTYRLDSDIPWPYRVISNVENNGVIGKIIAPSKEVKWKEPSLDMLRRKLDTKVDKKKKLVAWMVSNCYTKGKREDYVEELKKYIDVDLIGKCSEYGSPYCPVTKDCFDQFIERNYYFYLSFENVLCDDYVTEKFYNPLR